jgi:hypothetical protein
MTEVQTNEEVKSIAKISSANYGAFTKILSMLTGNMGKSDIINIDEGKLGSIAGGGFLHCDLSILFGENSFSIIDPQYSIKLLKLITGGDEVIFLDDEENAQYHVCNLVDDEPQINITLPKPDSNFATKLTYPEIGDLQEKIEIDPDLVNTMVTAEKTVDSQYFIVEILADENGKYNIISIATDKESFKYEFKHLKETDAEIIRYKLFNPFPIPKPDAISFELYKSISDTNNETFWIKTVSEIGLTKIEYIEKLTPMGQFDSLSLF